MFGLHLINVSSVNIKKEIINREDCPPAEAPFFPGQRTKNNKNGTTLSKIQFVNKVIEDWV